MTNRIRIQNALIDLARTARFYPVKYETGTNRAIDIDPTTAQIVAPASIRANESSAVFGLDLNKGRTYSGRRESWSFTLLLSFNQEVLLEFFEGFFLDPIHVLPPDRPHGLPAAEIRLVSAEVMHPVQQQPGSGTKVKYGFDVVLARG